MPRITIMRVMFFMATITLLVITYLGFRHIDQLIELSNLVNETHITRIQLERTYGQLRQADSDLNSFLMTGDTIFYENFQDTEKNLKVGISSLFAAMKDNPQQCFRLYNIEKLVAARYLVMEENVKTQDESKQRSNINKIQKLSNEIHAGIDSIVNEELNLLEQRKNMKSRQETFIPVVIFGLAMFALLLLLYTYIRLSKELRLRTRMQKELEVKNSELIHTNKELEHFAFGSSHDLQEPLRKIETFCSMIEDKNLLNGTPEGITLLNKIQSSTRRMRTMVNDLLGYARFYYSEDDNEMVNLNEVVEDVLQDFQSLIQEKNVVVKTSALPVIKGIQPQLHRLFQNLISNAIKYSRSEPVITIRSELTNGLDLEQNTGLVSKQGSFYRIIVADNGIGFENEFSDKIFQMFQRLHDKNRYDGTGIGLAICKKVVQNHGGFITAHGVRNEGSVFSVYLPAEPLDLQLMHTGEVMQN